MSNFTQFFKSFIKVENMSMSEILVLFAFVVYLILPIGTPHMVSEFIISPFGYLIIFIVTVFLFFYAHPILAILYVFVAYELLNRSNKSLGKGGGYKPTTLPRHVRINDVPQYSDDVPQYSDDDVTDYSDYNKSQVIADNSRMSKENTLEEEIINNMEPIGISHQTKFVTTEFKPIADSTAYAASFY